MKTHTLKASYRQLTGYELSKLGISYHGYGTLTHKGTRRVYGYYFKCDRLSADQRESLVNGFTGIEFKSSSPAYAPEIRSALIVQPSRAELKRRNA